VEDSVRTNDFRRGAIGNCTHCKNMSRAVPAPRLEEEM